MEHGALARLAAAGVVPVLRLDSAELALRCAEWLIEAGFACLELTLSIPDAFRLCHELSRRDGLTIGMGTVTSEADAARAVDAGAAFLVSPCVAADVAAVATEADLPCLLGAMTPTEVLHALRYGASAVKIFPASSCGGAEHVRALKAVFPSALLVPTGGIGIGDIGAYLRAGSAFVGIGGKLVDAKALAAGTREPVLTAARDALAAAAAARAA